MKVLHINTSDKVGGAAIAAFRLHDAMLSTGIDSKYLVLNRTINDRNDIATISKHKNFINRMLNIVLEKIATKNMGKIKGLFSSFKYGICISKRREVNEADIIYIHWINSFVNYHELKKILKKKKPVFWFMHDMFAITGGCHYSFDCVNYYVQCRKCPFHSKGIDQSKEQYNKKRKIYKQFNNLVFITPSKWLFDCAKKSELTENKQVYHIPNLIDKTVFKSINKNVARELFSLNNNAKIIGFGANSALTNFYKGWDYLKDALQILSKDETLQDKKIEILIFGSNYSKEIADSLPFPVHFLGHLHDDCSLVMAYNCMDVFVIPSIAENFPNTILESLSCNTPVVGFDTGGINDTVNANTGYLTEYRNSSDLARGVSVILKEGRENVYEYTKTFNVKAVLDKHVKMWKTEGVL